jgi:hypothetical protein
MSKSKSRSKSYKEGGGLFKDCIGNDHDDEDGTPIDPIDFGKIQLDKKLVLGNACYNKESLCQWLHINPTDPLTRETVPDEWMSINCPESLLTRILANIIYYSNFNT